MPMPQRDPVSASLREQVFERDREAIRTAWMIEGRMVQGGYGATCPAVLIDPAQLGKCWGRWTLDHIKDESRLGKRAPSDLAHLVSLCEAHTENGMKAGYQWNTANRPAIREYLRRVSA